MAWRQNNKARVKRRQRTARWRGGMAAAAYGGIKHHGGMAASVMAKGGGVSRGMAATAKTSAAANGKQTAWRHQLALGEMAM